MIDRRTFFSGFWKRGPQVHRTVADRKTRYKALEVHVQIHLLPNDFALTEAEESYLWGRVRDLLEQTSDRKLFSTDITRQLSRLVEDILEPLRMSSAEVTPNRQPAPLRQAAIEKVTTFLNNASEPEIEALKNRFSLANRADLEKHLRQEITTWIDAMEDSEVLKHDSFSIQDPVFAHLRALRP